jgi:hypothetical protein
MTDANAQRFFQRVRINWEMLRIMRCMAACLRAGFPHSAQNLCFIRVEVNFASTWERRNANIMIAPSVWSGWFPLFVSNADEIDEPPNRGHPALARCILQAGLSESRTQGGIDCRRQEFAGE